jgi:divalent metal cation (Fe/Co/Zn/Cd) transporter
MAAAAAAADEQELSARHLVALPSLYEDRTERLRRKGRRLEVATTTWNIAEVIAALILGFAANSLALIAFGLDSLVEVFASMVVLWHLSGLGVEGRSERARRLVSTAFLVLGFYLGAAGVHGLLERSGPAHSPAGIGVLAASLVAMLLLARSKRRVGLALSSPPLVADASMSLLDGLLAAGVLVALVLDLSMGWWWADPGAAIAIAAIAIREGVEGWQEHSKHEVDRPG